MTATGNQILDPVASGVSVIDSQNVRVSDTTVVEDGDEPQMRTALAFENSRGCQVHGCRLGRGTEGAIASTNSDVARINADNLIDAP